MLTKYEATARRTAPPTATQLASTTRPVVENPLPPGAGPEDYVRLAMQQNPSIRRAQYKVLRLGQRIGQATTPEDPTISMTPIGAMAETTAGDVGLMSSISQKFLFPGKLETAGRIAEQEMAEAVHELDETRQSVAADVRRTYWGYCYATAALDVTQRSRLILDEFKDVASARVQSGTSSQQDVLRISQELSSLDNQVLEWQQKKTTSVALLNSLLARPVDAPLGETAPMELASYSLQLEQLLAQAVHANPQLAKIRSQAQGQRERLMLAKLQRLPDLTVSFDYNFVNNSGLSPLADGTDQWWVTFGMNIPIWKNKLDAAEREAQNGILEAAADLADAQNRVGYRVQDALSRAQSQQKQAVIFRDTIIPQARQSLDVSLSDYKAGKLEFITLVDNWRRLLDFQLLYHQSLSQLEQNLADLQQAIGTETASFRK